MRFCCMVVRRGPAVYDTMYGLTLYELISLRALLRLRGRRERRGAPGRALRGLAAAASAHGRDSSCHSPRAPPHISALTRHKFDVLRCTLYATVYAVCCIWLYKRVRYNHTAEPHCHATPVPSCTVYSSYSTYTVQPYSIYTVHHHTTPLRECHRP